MTPEAKDIIIAMLNNGMFDSTKTFMEIAKDIKRIAAVIDEKTLDVKNMTDAEIELRLKELGYQKITK